MTTIRTSCPTCGEVDMGVSQVSLRFAAGTEDAAYAFTCPACRVEISKRANRKTVALLVAAGVEPTRTEELVESIDWSFPLDDQSPNPSAPAFTLDDLIDFHFLLEGDVVVDEMLSFGR
jgi:hypothetical protein